MGLDGLELILRCEETFDISISDEDSERIETVGDLYRLVLARTRVVREGRCLTQHTFYRLRRAMMTAWQTPRDDIRTHMPVSLLLPARWRWRQWRRLREALNLPMPALTLPPWAFSSYVVAWALGTIALAGDIRAGLCGMMLGLITAPVAWLITAPLRTVVPAHCTTVGDLTHAIAARNFEPLRVEAEGVSESDVWHTLRGIVVERLRVEPEDVRPEANFYRDLGCS